MSEKITNESIKAKMYEIHDHSFVNSLLFLPDKYASCFGGVTEDGRVLYSVNKMVFEAALDAGHEISKEYYDDVISDVKYICDKLGDRAPVLYYDRYCYLESSD